MTGGHAEPRAVVLDVPGGRIEHLPDPLQIGLSVARAWRGVRRGCRVLRGVRSGAEPDGPGDSQEDHRKDEPASHAHHLILAAHTDSRRKAALTAGLGRNAAPNVRYLPIVIDSS